VRIALLTTFAADRKQPLADLLRRLHAAFLAAGLGEPALLFTLSDTPALPALPIVQRALKRFPQLAGFAAMTQAMPGVPAVQQLSNAAATLAAGRAIDIATLLAVAAGVPKSLPFHYVTITLGAPGFGEAAFLQGRAGRTEPGVTVTDSWWVRHRQRSISAMVLLEADPAEPCLPPLPAPVAAVLAACGKVASISQHPLDGDSQDTVRAAVAPPEIAAAIRAVVADYQARLPDLVARLPHDLPSVAQVRATRRPGLASGPMKPALAHAFRPMGYDCTAGSGTFELRRRTAGNLTVELSLDVGSWSRSVTASLAVHGVGLRALLPLPVTRATLGVAQYPIGGPEHWQQIVDNLAALVAELELGFVPDVAAVAGPSPAWFRPET
jgi:hypothetical protein